VNSGIVLVRLKDVLLKPLFLLQASPSLAGCWNELARILCEDISVEEGVREGFTSRTSQMRQLLGGAESGASN
jgi:hypothetical protein